MKEIDIYFVAGQSNAGGTTKIIDAAALEADNPALVTGTRPYIMYAGNSAGNTPDNTVTYDWCDVRVGLGCSTSHMGPEVGMAKVFSSYYNKESGKVAGIIKFAHGATGLCNTEANTKPDAEGRYAGNWSPPSYVPHAPDDPALSYKGFLYRGFIAEARTRLNALKAMGFDKINVKGLYWMQGCNDTWRYTEDANSPAHYFYSTAFKCLVEDFRKDLKDIMQTVQGNYGGAQNMPFFIGTISPTYSLGSAKQGETFDDDGTLLDTAKKRNDPFIAMQKQLAIDNANCYIVDNGAYPTVTYVIENEGMPNQKVIYTMVGTDQSHWGQDACYEVGKNVGNLMLEKCTK